MQFSPIHSQHKQEDTRWGFLLLTTKRKDYEISLNDAYFKCLISIAQNSKLIENIMQFN